MEFYFEVMNFMILRIFLDFYEFIFIKNINIKILFKCLLMWLMMWHVHLCVTMWQRMRVPSDAHMVHMWCTSLVIKHLE